jgi:drug/metabolite transporter (DMT)-like permease
MLLWGGTFVAIRDTVADMHPATLVFLRFSVAAALFAVVLLFRRKVPSSRDVLAGLGTGAFMLGGYYFQAEGLRTASAGSSAFLTCAGTLLAALFAWPLLRQRPTRVLAAGLVLALAGSALMSLREGLHMGRGEVLTLVGAAIFALQVVAIGRFARTADPVVLTGAQALMVALVLAPFARDAGAVAHQLRGDAALRFAYLAIAGSTIAPLLQVYSQRVLPAGRIALLFALEPVFALVFALSVGAERFATRWWLGALLILSAVVLVEWRAATSTDRKASR